jgi:phosphoglycerol transferase MdoB-like AlkP superfamily enzyme
MMLIKRLLPYAVIFLVVETCVRLSLLARALLDIQFSVAEITKLLLQGFWFDGITAGFFLLPVGLYYLCFSATKQGGRGDLVGDTLFRFVFSYILLFSAVAEHLFWSEFTTRFNFIAVDYLVYTQEVIGNIAESYPLPLLLAAIGLGAAILTWGSQHVFPLPSGSDIFSRRLKNAALLTAASLALYVAGNLEQIKFPGNVQTNELAANGIYNLFYAFWHNEISYDRFYATHDDETVTKNIRTLLTRNGETFVHPEGKDLTRLIAAHHPEHKKNIILVVMESMSADYMGIFGNPEGLTPNLDRLAKEGLSFTQTYATGTRTVRGLEAVTLSIPPTPGQSILRRPDNDNLFSLGFLLRDRGYDATFVYGGYGYFDNMNNFFAGNGFDILDRTKMSKEETQFANVWGICDEDMFTRAIREADQSYKNGKPFLHLIMTTSNHRPYTYPDGRIDIPSHSNRLGGVKYADYSVGKLIEDAKKKPWFKDTVFIFVADHTAGAGGKAELDPRKYHIPMIFYAPGFITPQHIDRLVSQIDFAPTLLGMLGMRYYSKFYGEDLLDGAPETPHVFISNFQKVALVKNSELTVLAPKQKIEQYSWPDMTVKTAVDERNVDDAIAYYQSASWWKEEFKRIPTLIAPHVVAHNAETKSIP